MKYKALLFGSIGTLIESSNIQRNSFNEAFKEAGLDWYWDEQDYKILLKKSGGTKRVEDFAEKNNVNVTNIISSDGVTDFFNPNVIRSSIGHIFNINIFSEKSEKIISNLQRLNYEIISLDPDSAKSIKSYKPKKNYALVIGSEQYGISKIWKDNASQVLKIDTENKVDSLNASGAAAIAMWEFYKINE